MENLKNILKNFPTKELYYVGGCVRDKYMNRISNDVDLASSLTPEELIEWCNSENIKIEITNGIKHGTVLIIINGHVYEHTTFRRDIKSINSRHAEISFSDTIEEDLSRRDFTMNAIAENIFTGKIVNPFNGIEDINNKLIKFVGEPRLK